ncbi:MAG: cell division protein ZapA [Deltaproteobacteria bacterium]|nr:cell division protein ZapA [Deltaproteobacteria bacterium]MBW2444731.1 cell division protein ZapA [Deltaproteobacteria bacterium]
MTAARSVAIRIQGLEYRVRTDGEEGAIERVADYVDATMDRVRSRTKTVDSRDVAVLAALNIAKDLLALSDGGGPVVEGFERVASSRIEALADLIDDAEQA